MASVDTRARASAPAAGDATSTVPLSVRIRRAVPLIVGAVAMLLLVQPIGGLPPMGWIPVIAGLTYVAAAALSSRVGALWGPGIIIGIWGLAPMTTNYFPEFPGMFYLVLGTGLLLAAVLGNRLQISRMSMALPVLFIGGTMYVSSFVRADRYLTTVLAVLIGAWGLWELRPHSEDVRDSEDVRAGSAGQTA